MSLDKNNQQSTSHLKYFDLTYCSCEYKPFSYDKNLYAFGPKISQPEAFPNFTVLINAPSALPLAGLPLPVTISVQIYDLSPVLGLDVMLVFLLLRY